MHHGFFPNLLDTHHETAVDLGCALQTCGESNYVDKVPAADKRIYAPYIEQRKLLPDFLVVSPIHSTSAFICLPQILATGPQENFFSARRLPGAIHVLLTLRRLGNHCVEPH